MDSMSKFQRPHLISRADKIQNPSTVKYLLSLVTGRNNRTVPREEFLNHSQPARVPKIRQTSVVSNYNEVKSYGVGSLDERYEKNEVQRERIDNRASSIARDGRGIRQSNHQDLAQSIEYSFPYEDKQRIDLNRSAPAYPDGSPGSPSSSSSSMRSISTAFATRKVDRVVPEEAVIYSVGNNADALALSCWSSVNSPLNTNNLRQQQQQQQQQQRSNQCGYTEQIQLIKPNVASSSSSSTMIHGELPLFYARIRYDDRIENKELKGGNNVLCCDKCDGKHETENCHHYKKKREGHIDAQRNGWKLVGGSSTLPGAFLRFAKIVPQAGDGSCLFHSLSYGIKDNTNASILRYDISTYIQQHPHTLICDTPLSDWIKWDSNTSCTEYSRRMKNGAWGGGIEMACTSLLKGCNVHVYESLRAGGYRRISAFDHPARPEQKRIVRVLYRGGVHYDALLCPE